MFNVEPILEISKKINEQLEKENFKEAKFLLHDLIYELQQVERCLENWMIIKALKEVGKK